MIEAALADRDGSVTFFTFEEGAYHRGISSLQPGGEAARPIEVRAVRGATLRGEANLARCDFIKIDVEGAEGMVLRELSGLIEESRPHLVCEYRKDHWSRFGQTAEEWLPRLRSWGYDVFSVRKQSTRAVENLPPESCNLFCVPMK